MGGDKHVKGIDMNKTCPHMHVEIHTRLLAMQTIDQPAEYEQKAQCQDCGEWMDVEDVPDEAERRDA